MRARPRRLSSRTVNCLRWMTRPLISADERNIGLDGFAIKIKTDGAFLVGAVGNDSCMLESFEHLAAGMPVNISCPDGDDRIARVDSGEQARGGTAGAAVMRDQIGR